MSAVRLCVNEEKHTESEGVCAVCAYTVDTSTPHLSYPPCSLLCCADCSLILVDQALQATHHTQRVDLDGQWILYQAEGRRLWITTSGLRDILDAAKCDGHDQSSTLALQAFQHKLRQHVESFVTHARSSADDISPSPLQLPTITRDFYAEGVALLDAIYAATETNLNACVRDLFTWADSVKGQEEFGATLLFHCPSCRVPWIPDAGCSVITCEQPNCRAVFCCVCNKSAGYMGYDHSQIFHRGLNVEPTDLMRIFSINRAEQVTNFLNQRIRHPVLIAVLLLVVGDCHEQCWGGTLRGMRPEPPHHIPDLADPIQRASARSARQKQRLDLARVQLSPVHFVLRHRIKPTIDPHRDIVSGEWRTQAQDGFRYITIIRNVLLPILRGSRAISPFWLMPLCTPSTPQLWDDLVDDSSFRLARMQPLPLDEVHSHTSELEIAVIHGEVEDIILELATAVIFTAGKHTPLDFITMNQLDAFVRRMCAARTLHLRQLQSQLRQLRPYTSTQQVCYATSELLFICCQRTRLMVAALAKALFTLTKQRQRSVMCQMLFDGLPVLLMCSEVTTFLTEWNEMIVVGLEFRTQEECGTSVKHVEPVDLFLAQLNQDSVQPHAPGSWSVSQPNCRAGVQISRTRLALCETNLSVPMDDSLGEFTIEQMTRAWRAIATNVTRFKSNHGSRWIPVDLGQQLNRRFFSHLQSHTEEQTITAGDLHDGIEHFIFLFKWATELDRQIAQFAYRVFLVKSLSLLSQVDPHKFEEWSNAPHPALNQSLLMSLFQFMWGLVSCLRKGDQVDLSCQSYRVLFTGHVMVCYLRICIAVCKMLRRHIGHGVIHLDDRRSVQLFRFVEASVNIRFRPGPPIDASVALAVLVLDPLKEPRDLYTQTLVMSAELMTEWLTLVNDIPKQRLVLQIKGRDHTAWGPFCGPCALTTLSSYDINVIRRLHTLMLSLTSRAVEVEVGPQDVHIFTAIMSIYADLHAARFDFFQEPFLVPMVTQSFHDQDVLFHSMNITRRTSLRNLFTERTSEILFSLLSWLLNRMNEFLECANVESDTAMAFLTCCKFLRWINPLGENMEKKMLSCKNPLDKQNIVMSASALVRNMLQTVVVVIQSPSVNFPALNVIPISAPPTTTSDNVSPAGVTLPDTTPTTSNELSINIQTSILQILPWCARLPVQLDELTDANYAWLLISLPTSVLHSYNVSMATHWHAVQAVLSMLSRRVLQRLLHEHGDELIDCLFNAIISRHQTPDALPAQSITQNAVAAFGVLREVCMRIVRPSGHTPSDGVGTVIQDIESESDALSLRTFVKQTIQKVCLRFLFVDVHQCDWLDDSNWTRSLDSEIRVFESGPFEYTASSSYPRIFGLTCALELLWLLRKERDVLCLDPYASPTQLLQRIICTSKFWQSDSCVWFLDSSYWTHSEMANTKATMLMGITNEHLVGFMLGAQYLCPYLEQRDPSIPSLYSHDRDDVSETDRCRDIVDVFQFTLQSYDCLVKSGQASSVRTWRDISPTETLMLFFLRHPLLYMMILSNAVPYVIVDDELRDLALRSFTHIDVLDKHDRKRNTTLVRNEKKNCKLTETGLTKFLHKCSSFLCASWRNWSTEMVMQRLHRLLVLMDSIFTDRKSIIVTPLILDAAASLLTCVLSTTPSSSQNSFRNPLLSIQVAISQWVIDFVAWLVGERQCVHLNFFRVIPCVFSHAVFRHVIAELLELQDSFDFNLNDMSTHQQRECMEMLDDEDLVQQINDNHTQGETYEEMRISLQQNAAHASLFAIGPVSSSQTTSAGVSSSENHNNNVNDNHNDNGGGDGDGAQRNKRRRMTLTE